MKKLRGLQINHIDKYMEIANSKRDPHKTTLLSMAGEISSRYSDFDSLAADGELFNLEYLECGEDEKEALLKCYISRSKARNLLLRQIRLNQENFYKTICPYCEILHSTTFDHYVPKDSFPEFSMYALNLLPCCITCNEKKAEYWRNAQSCCIINYYYDDIPGEIFLLCTIAYNSGQVPTIRYSLDFPASIDSDHIFIIQSHYNRLNLIERYNEEAVIFLSEYRKTIMNFFSGTKNQLRMSLVNHAAEITSELGRNNFKTALIEALCDSDDFLNDMIVELS